MNIDLLMINLIIILFPILVNVLHELYIKNSDKKANDLFLDITLLSSMYLSITLNNNNCFLVLINIIFLLSLLKKRIFTSIIIFISIIINYKLNEISNLSVISIQYFIFYLVYILYYKYKREQLFINLFLMIKVIFILIFHISNNLTFINIINSILISLVFCLVTYLVLYIVKISEDIVRLHMNIKELEKEKQIRNSLFKITHEIKNPIAVCKSYLDMFDFNNPDHERYIKILKEEMNNILVLLQDFANMSKIKIKNEILDINLLLEEITRQLKPIIIDDDIEFIVDISDDELYIEGDYNRLSQVLTNLIKNAKEARDISKKSFISVKAEKEGNNFIIIVEDNGVGISKEDMKKIEEPFYTTKKNGTGLGVPLSLEIIKSHNGKLEFSSKQGEGTKVVISLPLGNIEF